MITTICRSTAQSHNAAVYRSKFRDWAMSYVRRIVPTESLQRNQAIPSSAVYITTVVLQGEPWLCFQVDLPKPRDLQTLDAEAIAFLQEKLSELVRRSTEDPSVLQLSSLTDLTQALRSSLDTIFTTTFESEWFWANRLLTAEYDLHEDTLTVLLNNQGNTTLRCSPPPPGS
jgi:hypothetical protein